MQCCSRFQISPSCTGGFQQPFQRWVSLGRGGEVQGMAGFVPLALVLRPLPASVWDGAPYALVAGRLKQTDLFLAVMSWLAR